MGAEMGAVFPNGAGNFVAAAAGAAPIGGEMDSLVSGCGLL
jgi:hypothetical protein